MLHTLQSLLAPTVMERVTLAANHVLGAEPVAVARLRPYAGQSFELALTGWPALLPPPPPLAFRITPAGLLEWCGLQPPAQPGLRLRVDAANPAALLARALAGETPDMAVDGDAALAADLHWLVQNVRWDLEADLERLFGPMAAQPLAVLARMMARALRAAVQGAGSLLRTRSP